MKVSSSQLYGVVVYWEQCLLLVGSEIGSKLSKLYAYFNSILRTFGTREIQSTKLNLYYDMLYEKMENRLDVSHKILFGLLALWHCECCRMKLI